MAKNDVETNEARAIGFTNVKTPNGYHWSFTVRFDSMDELVEGIENAEKILTEKKWEAEELRANFNKFPKKEAEFVPNMKCPTCGSPVVKGKTKDGREFYKCSTQKYDFATKTSSGCTYFAWINPAPVAPMPVATQTQAIEEPPVPDIPF